VSDLISREAAIARIQALLEKEKFGSEFRVPFLDAIGAIADMPSAVVSVVSGDDPLYITNTSVESLGGEFEAVWDANADKLYEP